MRLCAAGVSGGVGEETADSYLLEQANPARRYDYAVVVSRVDSALRLRASSGTATPPGSAEWAVLDSLRVELTVLRSRLEALGEGAP